MQWFPDHSSDVIWTKIGTKSFYNIYFYNGTTLDIILNKDLPQYQDVYKRIKTLAFAKNDGGKLLTNFRKSK